MSNITEDMHVRLRAALPEAVPVLLPEEAETPNRGAGKGQTPGIVGYLEREAPQGYVQIETPQAISSDGLTDVYWVPVASLAPDQATCAALARAVIGGLLFATPTTLLIVPYLFALLRKGNDGKTGHGVFAEDIP